MSKMVKNMFRKVAGWTFMLVVVLLALVILGGVRVFRGIDIDGFNPFSSRPNVTADLVAQAKAKVDALEGEVAAFEKELQAQIDDGLPPEVATTITKVIQKMNDTVVAERKNVENAESALTLNAVIDKIEAQQKAKETIRVALVDSQKSLLKSVSAADVQAEREAAENTE